MTEQLKSDAKGRVLILDDDPGVGRIFAIVSNQAGMEAKAVTEAEEFFLELRNWSPTHVVVDLIMPCMDGVQVLQRLAEMECDASVCVTSGAGSRVLKAAKQSAIEHGLVEPHALQKPVSIAEIEAFLADTSHIRRQAKRKAAAENPKITAQDLRLALDRRELFLAYQPIISCPDHKVRGFEALVRWMHPEHGLIMPDAFISISESTGLIHELTNRVVDIGLRWLKSDPVLDGKSLSVNISAKSFDDSKLPDRLGAAAQIAGVDPNQLILEVTESATMEDELLALDLFTRLRVKGFRVSIDDYGMGTSSLALLARLPFSEVKVDRSFAMEATESEDAKKIIRSTVDLSKSLDLEVVTEGVETEACLAFLDSIGCSFAQGYYIARPMAGDQAIEWVKNCPFAV